MREMLKVLVVDDDRRMVKTICDILHAKGFEAIAALTGEDAVAIASWENPDCVLMDVKMPGIDGVQAMAMMRESAPDLPVVLMSAFATHEQAETARSLGAHAILTKPIDIQTLLSYLSLLKQEECILIVDDDPLFRSTLGEILRSRNYQVETEDDPGRALKLMETKYELVVLLDVKLGEAGGLELLKDIRSRYPTKPVILVAGYGDESGHAVDQGLKIGAHTCLYKPFDAEALVTIIENVKRKKLGSLLEESHQQPPAAAPIGPDAPR